jgi:hypothetical protein
MLTHYKQSAADNTRGCTYTVDFMAEAAEVLVFEEPFLVALAVRQGKGQRHPGVQALLILHH